ncbi:hypothetical protein ACCT25_38230, partial [Rhizobium ruizarguesonis]
RCCREMGRRYTFEGGYMLTPDLHAILGELRAREPLFHHRELGTSRGDLLKMTADDFSEHDQPSGSGFL